jgi:predicted PurR-regulated permease PerM
MDHPSANRGPITPPAAGGGRTDDWLTALARLPWQRLLIWAVFLVALYTVRHFFFVIFTTFLLSYCIRSVVVPLADRLAPGRQGPWLERWLTLALFVVLVAGVAGVGFVVAPRFIDQSRSVIERVERVGPHQEFQHFLSRTVGAYQFHSQYGQPGGQRFERAYREYLAAHPQMDSPAAQTQFASLTRDQLAEAWWQGDPVAASLREQAGQELPRLLAGLGLRAQELARDAIAIPVEFVMALALTILITFDMHNLKQRMQSLRQTRIRGFYDEIVPELSTFARLIGRAFRAQAVVAVANTLLTAVVLWFLEIENEALLCGIVFACSFIPDFGVILSGIPIVLTALLQTNGSLGLALQVVVAITVIHLVEALVLNPRIVGNLLHLHPVMVLAILAAGSHFFGVWGLLLGVPVTVYVARVVILNVGIPGIAEPRT